MKHWIFDFDGTLVDTDGLFTQCLAHALEPFSVTVGAAFMEEIRHKHPHRIFEEILNDEQADQAMARLKVIGLELSEKIQMFPGIEKVLRTIEKHDTSLSIWTGRDRDSAERVLKRLGIYDSFEKVISGTCVEVNKPGHDGLIEIQNHFSAKENEMVMVGDHHHDIEPANQMGVLSIHARWKKDPQSLPKKIQPNYEFGCTDQFNDWVLNQLTN